MPRFIGPVEKWFPRNRQSYRPCFPFQRAAFYTQIKAMDMPEKHTFETSLNYNDFIRQKNMQMTMLDFKLRSALQSNISFFKPFVKLSRTFGAWGNLGIVKYHLCMVHNFRKKTVVFLFLLVIFTQLNKVGVLSWVGSKVGPCLDPNCPRQRLRQNVGRSVLQPFIRRPATVSNRFFRQYRYIHVTW